MSLQSPLHATAAEISGLFRIIDRERDQLADDIAAERAAVEREREALEQPTRSAFGRFARAAAAHINRVRS